MKWVVRANASEMSINSPVLIPTVVHSQPMDAENQASDGQGNALLRHIFGDLPDLMDQLAPQGWANSPYVLVHHPTPEQRHVEITIMYENLNRLGSKRKANQPDSKPLVVPTLDELSQEQTEKADPVKPLDELLAVFGGCVWSVFSNNHNVVGPNGMAYHLGSFRGTGSFLAEFMEQTYPDAPSFDYMDFYCADVFIERRADVTPVYELIFRRIQEQACDWLYSFPRIHLISFDHLKDEAPTDPAAYDPNKALADDAERQQRKQENRRLQEEFDQAAEEAMDEARYAEPPMIIRAYQSVFGRFPKGWVNE